ncbi:MAG: MBL fold metallo-hydrolase [Clostridia bacterium]|nr:MBL fold metallo-hydrolase [Clostridia bacterium]
MKIITLMENTAVSPALASEHGLSLYIETDTPQGLRRLLFDMGQSDAFLRNAQMLGVDLSLVDTAIISHGHYDHGGGLTAFLTVNDHAPVYVHREAFVPHYSGSRDRYIGLDPALAGSSRLCMTGDETDLGGGLRLVTCNACERRHADSAQGMLSEQDGTLAQDSFAHEQYLVVQEGGRRIVVSGCSHKGVLNIIEWLRPDILVGGFHYMKLDVQGSGRAVLEEAVQALAGGPVCYTCHCTGQEAYEYLKDRLGDRLHYLAAGSAEQV